ncbi:hypothetical protein BZA05DRAFT_126975 [Tricharina praecox]|uniref:uncharacterized protein n=1 Tax=Tricharina praecox TaxID=43433 RepID=UPI002220415B|nr:uncharacterized protein BZA05DRAFT_126975 [Tricharina praecox]KAI5847594.1 hypothetical protein BZA05DRAFT_126975 [Tricharina praecox]
MKFTTLLLSAIVLLAPSAVHADDTPALFDLSSSTDGLDGLVWNNVMFSGGNAYVGNVKYASSSEPLLLSGGSPSYGISFTSFHATPTGWRTLYVFANASAPLAFTTPHSASIPAGAQTVGFGSWDGKFQLDTGSGPAEMWVACKSPETEASGSWKINWDGNGTLAKTEGCSRVSLTVGKATECRYPQSA